MTRKKPCIDLKLSYPVLLETGMIGALLIAIGVANTSFPAKQQQPVPAIHVEELTLLLPPVTLNHPDPDPQPTPTAASGIDITTPLPEAPPVVSSEIESPVYKIHDFYPSVTLSQPSKPALAKVSVERKPEMIGAEADFRNKIKYPEQARKTGIEGIVEVEFTVSPSGRVKNPVIIRGIGGGCDEAVLNAIRRQKYKPGFKDGKITAIRIRETVQFVLLNRSK